MQRDIAVAEWEQMEMCSLINPAESQGWKQASVRE